jgi:copper ion binding protein
MPEQTLRIAGMTCEHCVAAVTREVQAIPGVSRVQVSLDPGAVTFSGENVTTAEVRAAVVEAGYDLA